jgi:hypothetical protein
MLLIHFEIPRKISEDVYIAIVCILAEKLENKRTAIYGCYLFCFIWKIVILYTINCCSQRWVQHVTTGTMSLTSLFVPLTACTYLSSAFFCSHGQECSDNLSLAIQPNWGYLPGYSLPYMVMWTPGWAPKDVQPRPGLPLPSLLKYDLRLHQ